MRIKVSGFPGITNKDELKRVFSEYGTVESVEKELGQNIAYITMSYDYQALKAVLAIDGTKILGRIIKVEEQI
jgi:RNA recognition motif-containing protein